MTSTRTFLRILGVVLTSLVLGAFAAPTSDFTGSYKLGNPSAAGKDVQLTIMLTVSNNTSSGISNATIALHEPNAARVTYGALTGLSLPAGGHAVVNGSFTVPQSLYDSWRKGSSPAMSVSFTDANGNPVRTFIEF